MTAPAPTNDPAPVAAPAAPTLAPDTSPEPAPAPVVSDWKTTRASLSPDIRDNPALNRFENVDGLAKSYLGQLDVIGRKGILPPREGDAADLARYRGEIGVPASPAGYKEAMSAVTVPEGLEIADDLALKQFARFHEIGLTPDQAQKLANGFLKDQSAGFAARRDQIDAAYQQAERTLKTEWGTTFEARMDGVAAVTTRYFDSLADIPLADGRRLGDTVEFCQAAAKIHADAGEHSFVAAGKAGPITGRTPEVALAEIRTRKADTEFQQKLRTKSHPEHEDAAAQWSQLHQQAYPDARPGAPEE